MPGLSTVVTAVTVFRDRARVSRAGRATLEAGLQRVAITDLPLALMPDSVRATGRGTARAKLLGVTTRLEHFGDSPAELARELEDKLLATQDADAEQASRAAGLEQAVKHLDSLAAQSEMYARGLALRDRSPERQGELFDFITRRSHELRVDVLKAGRERRELAKEIDRLKRELARVQSARPRQRHSAVVELDVQEPGELTLELSYMVGGAAWSPLYDIRLMDSTVELTYLAQVTQNTGEAWDNVDVTLSTAQPSVSLTIPELDPWYVHAAAPPVPLAKAAPRGGAYALAPAAAPQVASVTFGLEAREAAVETDTADVSEAGAALTYHLSGRADIPGDNTPRRVTVGTAAFEPRLDYVTAPRLEEACYRRATVVNDSAYSLLPGRAQLFEGDNYLGATALEFVAPRQEFELMLGSDERLRVERELAARDVDKAFLIGDRRRLRYAYTIEVQNLRDAPQTVYVRDQLPVSRDEQIKVRLDAAEPKPAEHDDLNRLEWKLTVPPSGKHTIRLEYSVEHPRAMTVIGLA